MGPYLYETKDKNYISCSPTDSTSCLLIVCLLLFYGDEGYGGVWQYSFYENGHASYGHVHALYGCDEHFFYGDSYFFSISKHLKKIKIKMT